jgi:hypothetical protein
MSLSEAINLLSDCKDLDQLAVVWKTNVGGWSKKFIKGDAQQLIRIKDELKAKLTLPGPSELNRICDDLLQAYPRMGYRNNQNRWVTLCSIPGWRDELRNLQTDFLKAYEAGSDCYLEFEGLRIHWQEGWTHVSK